LYRKDLLVQNKGYINGQTSQMKIKYNSNTMFVYPITEHRLNQVVSKLKGKSSTGCDQIPGFLVRECIQYIKKLIFIFHVSVNKGIFPDSMKIAKIRPIKKVIDMTVVITGLYPFYQFSKKNLEKLI
jgi:hypothetical protein